MIWNYENIKQVAKQIKGITAYDLIVEKPQNDPYYIGTISDKRHAKWISEHVKEFLKNRNLDKIHCRAIHYYLLSKNIKYPSRRTEWKTYNGSNADFHWCILAIRNARILGYLDWNQIVEERNPDLIEYAYYPSYPNPKKIDKPKWNGTFDIDNLPSFDIDIIIDNIVNGCTVEFNSKLQQYYHVEVWVEKSTMNSILEPICKKYEVNLQTFKGHATSTKVYELMKRIKEINKPTMILYISDYDKYGENIAVASGRKLQWFVDKYFTGTSVQLDRIALTKEQIEKYTLPYAPDAKNKVELDALEVYYPNELGNILEEELKNYIDLELYDELREIEHEIEESIRAEVRVILEDNSTKRINRKNECRNSKGKWDDKESTQVC